MRGIIHIGAAMVAMLATGTAYAAPMRFDCHKPGKVPTYVDIDLDAKTMMVSEAAGTSGVDFARQPVCSAFVAIISGVGSNAEAYTRVSRCTIAFGKTAIVADYVSNGAPKDFALTIGIDLETKTMTTVVRFGTDSTVLSTAPCTRLS